MTYSFLKEKRGAAPGVEERGFARCSGRRGKSSQDIMYGRRTNLKKKDSRVILLDSIKEILIELITYSYTFGVQGMMPYL